MSVDFEKIKQFNEELRFFLEKHPEMQSYQDEIEDALKKVGSDKNKRMTLLKSMMEEKLTELADAFTDLARICDGQPTIDQEVQRILSDRVKLRCTNKDCQLSSGFWTASSFKENYLIKIDCILCGKKHAEMIEGVKND